MVCVVWPILGWKTSQNMGRIFDDVDILKPHQTTQLFKSLLNSKNNMVLDYFFKNYIYSKNIKTRNMWMSVFENYACVRTIKFLRTGNSCFSRLWCEVKNWLILEVICYKVILISSVFFVYDAFHNGSNER